MSKPKTYLGIDNLNKKLTRINKETIKHAWENGWDAELGDNN